MKVTIIGKPSSEACELAARMCYGAKDGMKALPEPPKEEA